MPQTVPPYIRIIDTRFGKKNAERLNLSILDTAGEMILYHSFSETR